MLNALLLAFATVFVAELGDKSQLLALSLASRYRTPLLLAAVTTAAALTMAASVLVGAALGSALPTRPLLVAAALLFLGFAIRTWREDPEDEEGADEPGGAGGFIAVVAGISLAELGDKTMVAALALAATTSAWGVWIGGTLGMASAGILAVLLGKALWQRLSPDTVRRVSAGLFAVMGLVLLVEALR
ncbi:MAG TPA: TMEM165/GDT1 family protein [Egicoccus sp.]|nr:TMEM165/GDT1 family protein [Egicoccus sp.]HSK21725.1 TMEM165/GDT1 family protein [Egicoccus sp.]